MIKYQFCVLGNKATEKVTLLIAEFKNLGPYDTFDEALEAGKKHLEGYEYNYEGLKKWKWA